MSNGNPYYIDPRADVYSRGISSITQALEGRRARESEEKAKQKAEARYDSFIQEYDAAMASGDPRAINKLSIKYPEYAAASKGALAILEDESDESKIGREKEFSGRLFDYLGEENPLKQREMILGNIENLESQGRDATHQKRLLQQHDQDPTKGKELAEWEFGKIVGDKEFKRYQGIRGEVEKKVDQKQINTLRKEIDQVSKPLVATEQAFDKIEKTFKSGKAPTGPSDMTYIWNYMKMLDPGVAVMEGDVANAKNTASVPDWIVNKYNAARGGTILGQTERENFYDQSVLMLQSITDVTDRSLWTIAGRAEQDKLDLESVFTKKGAESLKSRREARQNIAEESRQQAVQAQAQPKPQPSASMPSDLGQLSDEELDRLIAGAQ